MRLKGLFVVVGISVLISVPKAQIFWSGAVNGAGTINPASPQQSDFTLAGVFDLPAQADNTDTGALAGFTIRYVSGVRHLLWRTGIPKEELYDVIYPGMAVSAPYPIGTYPAWGGNYGSSDFNTGAVIICTSCASNGIAPGGLYWDVIGSRLYTNYYSVYGFQPADYSFYASTIDDSVHTIAVQGCYGFNQNQRLTNTGILSLPSWFSSLYSVGRLASGFGDPDQSALSGGIGSDGPTMTSFTPDIGTNACPDPISFLSKNTLLKFGDGVESSPWDAPQPARTSLTTYVDQMNNWNPHLGVGYFIRESIGGQNCAWVNTNNVSGPVCIGLMGNGDYTASITAVGSLTTFGGSFTVDTKLLADGTSIQIGDVLNVQQGSIGPNCSNTCDVSVTGVSGNILTFNDTGSTTCKSGGTAPLNGGAVFGAGTFYCNATIQATRGRHRWFTYSTSDIGAVISGSKQPYEPNSYAEWAGSFDSDNFVEPTPGFTGSRNLYRANLAWDLQTNQLFVAIDHASTQGNFGCAAGIGNVSCAPRVYVYNVR